MFKGFVAGFVGGVAATVITLHVGWANIGRQLDGMQGPAKTAIAEVKAAVSK